MTIKWLTINVHNLEASQAFYGEYLRLELKSAFSPNDMMSIVFYEAENGMQIELIKRHTPEASAIANSSVAIGISSTHYETLLIQARERAILTSEPHKMGLMECFFVKDPDNISIQIIKA
ncbi:MAG: VOC family protein [Cellulosilyticaceae bacterium]